MVTVRTVGKVLAEANPLELAIGNIVRRVLYIIRQEVAHIVKAKLGDDATVDLTVGLHKLLDEEKTNEVDLSNTELMADLKGPVIEEITELMEEISTVYNNIADQAIEHIHAKEVIMTFGISRAVTEFFKEAAKLRKFEVIVAEGAPSFTGQKMAVQLSEIGIDVTVITDSAVFGMMSAVNKVIIGTHAVMANGGLVAHTGAHNIAVAAKAHSVPFVVVTGLYKLCPLYSFDQDTLNDHNAPSQVLKFEEEYVQHVDVENPAYDYVAPGLVSLYITNL